MPLFRFPPFPALAAGVALCIAGASPAAARPLTAKDGRTMEADILGYRGETLRVRRADTGKEFRLPISSLAADDQETLRAFIKEHPELRDAIKPGDVRVEFSRAKFDRDLGDRTYYSDENIESWGYSVAVLNQTSQPVEGLRVDYVVFAQKDPDGVYAEKKSARDAEFERVAGNETLEAIGSGQRATVRTKPVVSRRTKYGQDSGIITADGKIRRSWRDKALFGVWLRVYDGDRLVHEASSPDSLRTAERWAGGGAGN